MPAPDLVAFSRAKEIAAGAEFINLKSLASHEPRQRWKAYSFTDGHEFRLIQFPLWIPSRGKAMTRMRTMLPESLPDCVFRFTADEGDIGRGHTLPEEKAEGQRLNAKVIFRIIFSAFGLQPSALFLCYAT